MQTNGVLALLDTSTNPATVLFVSPNTPQNPPQSNVVCLMAANGILQLRLGAAILCSSTNPVSLRAALFVEDTGIAAIMKNAVNTPANDLWDTTQSMANSHLAGRGELKPPSTKLRAQTSRVAEASVLPLRMTGPGIVVGAATSLFAALLDRRDKLSRSGKSE